MKLHLPQVSEFWRYTLQLFDWAIAIAWTLRAYDTLNGLPKVPDLRMTDWDIDPATNPTLTVIVPAKDEAENIAATLDALLQADYKHLHILAINDRSTDNTGTILNDYVAQHPTKITTLHITDLPDGWLGKTFALSTATDHTQSDYLLFTDADVLFSPSILRRAVTYAEASRADHLVVLPTMQIKRWTEGMVLGFFQVLGLWASRPWRVGDINSSRDIVGVGAFNLVRRDALSELGGWAPQRLAVLEDVTLGRRIKAAGMRQRIAFAPGFVLVHWAAGLRGLMRVMVKNMFSAFNFRPLLLLGMILWVTLFFLAPIAGLAWWGTLIPSLLILGCIASMYRAIGQVSEINPRYAWLYPLGAITFIAVMLRSMATVTFQRGVVWRGTHYALADLRQHNSPFQWQTEAANQRRRNQGKRV